MSRWRCAGSVDTPVSLQKRDMSGACFFVKQERKGNLLWNGKDLGATCGGDSFLRTLFDRRCGGYLVKERKGLCQELGRGLAVLGVDSGSVLRGADRTRGLR